MLGFAELSGLCWSLLALLGFAGLCCALLGFAGPCWALLGFAGLCKALLGFAGLCSALLAFTGFCWALLGFGLSWGRLRKASKSRAVHVFVDRCAFRSPARSGLIPSWRSWRLMLASWALLGPLFFVFGRICVRSGVLKRFFLILDRFWEDFGSISGGFWEYFSKIFGIFSENADLQNSCAHAVFRKGRALKN